MTEKRFEVTFNDSDFHLKDNETGEELELVDEKVCYDYIADRWNALHENNERLKEYNNKLMKQPLLFDVQTIPNTMEIIEANNQLEKENEQLKKELSAFKPVMFQDMRKGTVILYSKEDVKE